MVLAVSAVMIPCFATSTTVLISYLDMRYVKREEYIDARAAILSAANNESSERKAADSQAERELAILQEQLRPRERGER